MNGWRVWHKVQMRDTNLIVFSQFYCSNLLSVETTRHTASLLKSLLRRDSRYPALV